MDIKDTLEWAMDTIKNKTMFGLEALDASMSRERRAYGAMMDAKKEIVKLESQNEIYRKSNDIYKKALERIVTDSGGGSKVNHLNMVESCIKCAEQALQDAQKLAGGK